MWRLPHLHAIELLSHLRAPDCGKALLDRWRQREEVAADTCQSAGGLGDQSTLPTVARSRPVPGIWSSERARAAIASRNACVCTVQTVDICRSAMTRAQARSVGASIAQSQRHVNDPRLRFVVGCNCICLPLHAAPRARPLAPRPSAAPHHLAAAERLK